MNKRIVVGKIDPDRHSSSDIYMATGIVATLTSAMGMGGGYVPYVIRYGNLQDSSESGEKSE